MRINNNISSLHTQGALFSNNRAVSNNLEKLSTGLRINRASDDAAGLALSEGLRTQVRGAQQAKRNALDGISALNIAEGAMNELHNIMQRQRELAIQASTNTYSDTERSYMDSEFQALSAEIERIIEETNFNGIKLLTPNQVSVDTFATNERLHLSSVNEVRTNAIKDLADQIRGVIPFENSAEASAAPTPQARVAAELAHERNILQMATNAIDDNLMAIIADTSGTFNVASFQVRAAVPAGISQAGIDVGLTAAGTGITGVANPAAMTESEWNGLSQTIRDAIADVGGFSLPAAWEQDGTGDGTATTPLNLQNLGLHNAAVAAAMSGGFAINTSNIIQLNVENRERGGNSQFNGEDLWIGANDVRNVDSIKVDYGAINLISAATRIDGADGSNAIAAIAAMDASIEEVSRARSDIGALVNRLESTINNLTTSIVNQQAAESQIRDVDFAAEASKFTTNQILVQSATSMLSQANASSQGVLALLR